MIPQKFERKKKRKTVPQGIESGTSWLLAGAGPEILQGGQQYVTVHVIKTTVEFELAGNHVLAMG